MLARYPAGRSRQTPVRGVHVVGVVIALSAACGPFDGAGGPCKGLRAADVQAFFSAEGNPMLGGDYQRAHALGGERTLWTFQDAIMLDASGNEVFAHNAAALQDGDCWTVLNAPDGNPWLLADRTESKQRWFWPLGSTLSADGATLAMFVAELTEHGADYLDHVEPIGVQLVTLDAATLGVIDVITPPTPPTDLYGWSVASDDEWAYLYAWCYRQWGWSDTGHDISCTGQIRLARVPLVQLTAAPEYWDGAAWQGDAAAAVSVFDDSLGDVRPTEVHYDDDDGAFLAVTKPGDWYGNTVYVDRAPDPFGPWTRTDTLTIAPKCAPDTCNTYFVSFAGKIDGNYRLAISHNRWDGTGTAEPVVYRPSVFTVAADGGSPTSSTILTYPD
jgi:hypothetical protein